MPRQPVWPHWSFVAFKQAAPSSAWRTRQCRFCNAVLPDWRPTLTPANLEPATPVVSVHFNGTVYRIKVKPGANGFAQVREF